MEEVKVTKRLELVKTLFMGHFETEQGKSEEIRRSINWLGTRMMNSGYISRR